MAKENVGKFFEAVMADEKKKQKLGEITEKFAGKEVDETQLTPVLEEHVLPMAANMGFSFTLEELRAYRQEQYQASGQVSDEELEAVAGGSFQDHFQAGKNFLNTLFGPKQDPMSCPLGITGQLS